MRLPQRKQTDQARTRFRRFGGLFDLKAAGFTDPILVAATDGVGTKLNRHRRLASIEANTGGDAFYYSGTRCTALFFPDYFATGKLEPDVAASIIGRCC